MSYYLLFETRDVKGTSWYKDSGNWASRTSASIVKHKSGLQLMQ